MIATFEEIIKNNIYLGPLITFIAGILASFSPCSLSTVPVIVTYISNENIKTKKQSFVLSTFFVIGNSITYTVLGIIASLFGKIFNFSGNITYLILGILLLVIVFQMLEIIDVMPKGKLIKPSNKKGYLRAFTTGLLSGLITSPCSTPILIVILTIASLKGSLIYGIITLFTYALGHSIVVLVAGVSTEHINKIIKSKKRNILNNIIKYFFCILTLIIAIYLIYLGI